VGATLERCKKGDSWPLDTWAWVYIIEVAGKHPDRIRRKPKIVLTDDDKAIAKRYIANGLKWLAVNRILHNRTNAYSNRPTLKHGKFSNSEALYECSTVVKGFLFPWATHEGSPYYLPDLVREDKS